MHIHIQLATRNAHLFSLDVFDKANSENACHCGASISKLCRDPALFWPAMLFIYQGIDVSLHREATDSVIYILYAITYKLLL